MRVNDVLRHKAGASGRGAAVVTIAPGRSVRELLALLADRDVGAVVVSGDGEHVEGIVSERDVVRRLHAGGDGILDGPVTAIMTADVRTCGRGDHLDALMAAMTEGHIRHLPVVEEGRLVGIVSIGDVVKQRIAEISDERDQLSAYISR